MVRDTNLSPICRWFTISSSSISHLADHLLFLNLPSALHLPAQSPIDVGFGFQHPAAAHCSRNIAKFTFSEFLDP
ncbi:hypothetical protein Droror1_Dr00016129 [Drosera rotundifolia]